MIAELDEHEIDAFLRRCVIGRIGCHADGHTYVVPVVYVWEGECLYVQSIEGRKVRMMRANPQVVFEVDEYESDSGSWQSVIVEGVYEELEGSRAEAALTLLVRRFVGGKRTDGDRSTGRRPVTFRIRATRTTGRRVTRTVTARAVTRLGIAINRRRARRSAAGGS